MKKLIFILSLLCMASVAFAEESKFSAGASGIGYYAGYNGVAKDSKGAYTALRIRPGFEYEKSGLKAVFLLEYDALFGDSSENNAVGVGGDVKGVEVKHAYVTSNVDAVKGLSLTLGVAEYDFPLVFSDDVALAGLNYETAGVAVGLYCLKLEENGLSNEPTKDDANLYALNAEVKAGPATLMPALFVYQGDKGSSSTYADSMGYVPALAANVAMGAMGVDLAFAYATGKNKVTDVKYSGYALDVAPCFQVNKDMKVTAFFSMASGDDGSKADEKKSFADANPEYAAPGRLFILENGGSFTTHDDVTAGDVSGTTAGAMFAGASFEAGFGAVSVLAQVGYGQSLEGDDKDFGIEADLNVSYELTEGSSLYLEGAFLKTGKFFGDSDVTQNASYVNLGMTYSL